MKTFDDIILRKYFNITDYLYSTIECITYFKKRKYSYFQENINTIVVGYIINTINGLNEYPIIDMNNIRIRKRLIIDLKIKYNEKIKVIILKQTILPIDIIYNILNYL